MYSKDPETAREGRRRGERDVDMRMRDKKCDRINRWELKDKAVACLIYTHFEGQENILELIRFLLRILRYRRLLEKMKITWSLNVENPTEIIKKGLIEQVG
ncbi:uncharacterized protein LOC119982285 [Tripterygium wilfordii]|uniref:uncharacterized protein LOC119982285 n=1 Tax=Tripterygium wilfordii TaxID=458696 RepID=UPI0018F854BF|nr:uncharacterized protein LOC119982285 [Tripterygium wilfordii]